MTNQAENQFEAVRIVPRTDIILVYLHAITMILTRGALNAFLALAVTSFLLVFLYNHLVTEVSDVEAAKDPWRYGFPSWYGRQERVVEERYDTRILLKDRLLLLTSEISLRTKYYVS